MLTSVYGEHAHQTHTHASLSRATKTPLYELSLSSRWSCVCVITVSVHRRLPSVGSILIPRIYNGQRQAQATQHVTNRTRSRLFADGMRSAANGRVRVHSSDARVMFWSHVSKWFVTHTRPRRRSTWRYRSESLHASSGQYITTTTIVRTRSLANIANPLLVSRKARCDFV